MPIISAAAKVIGSQGDWYHGAVTEVGNLDVWFREYSV